MPTAIKFSIQQDSTNPAISIDANGVVHALHPGSAIVTGDFAGVTAQLHVTVENEQ